MIEAEQLHARILARLDMTRDMEDEELTELIYEVLQEVSQEEYLPLDQKTMLGKDTFYIDWFYIYDDVSGKSILNEELVNTLITFITEFLNLDINIITDTDNINTMFCPSLDNSSDSCNRSIIQNYLKVLEFVKTNTILENKNKIKVYGETFGELLPKLSF